jgi:MarR family transcriptional regulator for hemolysin
MNEFFGRQLSMTAKAFRAEFDARLAGVGGSLSTWIVLRLADASVLQSGEVPPEALREASDEAPEDCALSQRELADRMDIEGPTLVRHLDRLEKEGLIERRRDAHDRRVTRIMVTPAGHRMLGRLREVADAMEAEVRSLFTPPEHDTVLRALSRLHAHLKALHAEREEGKEIHAHTTR